LVRSAAAAAAMAGARLLLSCWVSCSTCPASC
jgi:hypothetical protein